MTKTSKLRLRAALVLTLLAFGCATTAPPGKASAKSVQRAAARRAPPPQPEATSASSTQTPSQLPQRERSPLEYVFASLETLPGDWPWMTTEQTCVLLVSQKTQWILNCEEPPSPVFSALAETFRGRPVFAQEAGTFRMGDKEVPAEAFIRAVPATANVQHPDQDSDLSGEHLIIASSLEALIKYHPAFGEDATTEEWMGVFIHEFFHTRQMLVPSFAETLGQVLRGDLNGDALTKLYETDETYKQLVEKDSNS